MPLVTLPTGISIITAPGDGVPDASGVPVKCTATDSENPPHKATFPAFGSL
jgi:hypothetical protein